MTHLIDSTLQVWLPGDQDKTYRTRSVSLDDETDLYISVQEPWPFPTVDIAMREDGLSLTVESSTPVRVAVQTRTKDAVAVWHPGSGEDSTRLPASWEDARVSAALNKMTLGALLGRDDLALAAWGATAGASRLHTRAGLVEENADLFVSVEVDEAPQAPLRLEWRRGRRLFADTVTDLVSALVHPARPVSNHDLEPVLCTWYFQHLHIDGQHLETMSTLAGELGFGTLIVDDGWQTEETERGYGSTGDWQVNAAKIENAAAFVNTWHDAGVRVLWWVGTPFIGYRSQAYLTVPAIFEEPALDTAVLDPRDAGAAVQLINNLRELLRTSGADGFKLDFLERFSLPEHPADIDNAAIEMLNDLMTSLRQDRPDVSIEFREPYFGPEIATLSTMMRVGDCPMSATRNKKGIADLRLATRGIAVHSDPVMWAAQDSAARVGQHLQNALFGVLQVSMDLSKLSGEHLDVLRFWLEFARENREVLLESEFRPLRPDLNYPVIEARNHDTVITGRYQPVQLHVPEGPWRTWFIANADSEKLLLEGAPSEELEVTIYSPSGTSSRAYIQSGLDEISVPTGGLVRIKRVQHG